MPSTEASPSEPSMRVPIVETEASRPIASVESRGWFLHCELPGLPPDEARATRITVTGKNHFNWPDDLVASGFATSDGSATVDVTQLLLGGHYARTPLDALVVDIDSPLSMPTREFLPATAAHRVMAELNDLDGPITWQARIELQPAAAGSGRVVDEDDHPISGAAVAAWPMVDGRPTGEAEAKGTTDSNGAFRLRLDRSATFFVAAWTETLHPATASTPLELRRESTIAAPLVLRESAFLRGRTFVLGRPVAGARVIVRAVRERKDHQLRLPHDPFGEFPGAMWRRDFFERGGRLHTASRMPTSDAEGRWKATSLTPGRYTASIELLPGDGPHLSSYPQGEVEVEAPARRVDLEYGYSALRLESQVELPQEGSGRVTITQENTAPRILDFTVARPLGPIVGTPGEVVDVRIEFDGHRPWQATLTLPARGEELTVPFRLEAGPEPSALTLEIRVPTGESAPRLWLGLFEPETSRGRPKFEFAVPDTDGVAHFAELPPGMFTAIARVLDDSPYCPKSNLLENRFALGLEPGRSARKTLDFVLGGKLSLVARTEAGTPLAARFEVHDASGRKLEVRLIAATGHGSVTTTYELATIAPNVSFPNLAAGTYELAIWYAGFRRKTETITIVAGETTTVDWRLARE
jgi:hypothetical protein